MAKQKPGRGEADVSAPINYKGKRVSFVTSDAGWTVHVEGVPVGLVTRVAKEYHAAANPLPTLLDQPAFRAAVTTIVQQTLNP